MALSNLQQSALVFAAKEHATPSQNWSRLCLGFVRRAFGAPAMQNAVPAGGTAKMAWDRAKVRHKFHGDYDSVPAGRAFVWSGGSKGAGHIVVTVGNGLCWTNDAKRPGKIDKVSLASITKAWGMTPLGYIDDVNGKTIYSPPPPEKQFTARVGKALLVQEPGHPEVYLLAHIVNPEALKAVQTALREAGYTTTVKRAGLPLRP